MAPTCKALSAVAALTAASRLVHERQVTGPIIRARVFENDDKQSYYVAVDNVSRRRSGRFA